MIENDNPAKDQKKCQQTTAFESPRNDIKIDRTHNKHKKETTTMQRPQTAGMITQLERGDYSEEVGPGSPFKTRNIKRPQSAMRNQIKKNPIYNQKIENDSDDEYDTNDISDVESEDSDISEHAKKLHLAETEKLLREKLEKLKMERQELENAYHTHVSLILKLFYFIFCFRFAEI